LTTVQVCGGRDFNNLPLFDRTMDALHAEHSFTRVVHGGARGADVMAQFWTGATGIPISVYHADWKRDGLAAGPIRNQRMLDEGKLRPRGGLPWWARNSGWWWSHDQEIDAVVRAVVRVRPKGIFSAVEK